MRHILIFSNFIYNYIILNINYYFYYNIKDIKIWIDHSEKYMLRMQFSTEKLALNLNVYNVSIKPAIYEEMNCMIPKTLRIILKESKINQLQK